MPILQKNCLACHNKSDAESDLVLETPQAIIAGGSEGPSVERGNASASFLMKVATHQSDPAMPPKDNKVGAKNLTAEQLGLLKLWIEQGAQGEVKGASGPLAWQKIDIAAGPIYAVAIAADDTPETLAARILVQEHRIYPLAVRLIVEGRARTAGGVVAIETYELPDDVLINPPLA